MSTGDYAGMLDDFARRLYNVEQMVSDPSVVGSNEFSEIVVDDGDGNVVIIVPQPPKPPTNIVVTTGSFFDVIYADVSWDAPVYDPLFGEVEVPVLVYQIEIAKKIAGVYELARVESTAGTDIRIEPLEPNTTYGVRIAAMSNIGKISTVTAWYDFDSGEDHTAPGIPTGVVMARGASSVVVKWNGSTDEDMILGRGLYEVQIDTTNLFNSGNLRTIRSTANVVAFNDVNTEGTWYARVAAIDSSGNMSGYAVASSITAGGVNDSMLIADISAAKITVGTMSGDRITANTLDAGAIKSSSITSANITLAGGSFKAGNPPTTGLLINSQGLRLYNAGVTSMVLDAGTGSATFAGNITGGTIQIGTRFSVDASGNMSATNGDFEGNIDGSTITGSLFRTSSSGARLVLSETPVTGGPSGLTGYGVQLYTGNETSAEKWGFVGMVSVGSGTSEQSVLLLCPSGSAGVYTAPAVPMMNMYARSAGGASSYIIMSADLYDFQGGEAHFDSTMVVDGLLTAGILYSTNEIYIDAQSSTGIKLDAEGAGTNGRIMSCNSGSDGNAEGWAAAWVATSASDQKKNIRNAEKVDALSVIRRIKPKTFEWKDPQANGKRFGALAEELPEEIAGFADGVPRGVDLVQTVMYLAKAVQELDARLDALEAA